MANSGTGRACSLIEVARVLVQKRWQYGAADQDVGKTIGGGCAKTLSICPPTLAVIQAVSSLPSSGDQQDSGSGNWICGDFQGQLELHSRGQWCWVALIRNVKVRNDSEHALLLLSLELLSCDLNGIVMNINRNSFGCNSQSDAGHNFELVGTKCDRGRRPVCKTLGADPELIRNGWLHIVKLEQPVSGCHDCARVSAIHFLENDRRVRDRIAIDIGGGTYNCCCLCRRGVVLAPGWHGKG